jgi:hypothetical protein
VHAREEARRELGRLFAHLPSPPALTEEVVELPDGSRESYLCEVKVRDRPFWIARVPVTNALYERFDPDHRHHRQYDDGPGSELLDHHPVVNVDWHEATMFCAWLAQLNAGASLPATDDWALAAAGEDEREYPWGSTPEPIPTHANYRDAGIGRTSRVGSFPLGRGPSGTPGSGRKRVGVVRSRRGSGECRGPYSTGVARRLLARRFRLSAPEHLDRTARLEPEPGFWLSRGSCPPP